MTSQATRTLDAGDPIAVVGMACRYPRAASPAEFWRLLHDGVDAITEVPADRWDVDAFFDAEPAKPSKMYTRWGGFIDAVDQFDPAFFGISLREAQRMDPQQRMLLEVAWEALEDAVIPPDSLQDTATGVFVGICNSDYRLLGGDLATLDAYVATGTCFSIAANRLSYSLNLRGPSLAVDTACSSSLVAVHLACQSLKWGESDLAIVGGVNLILSPAGTVTLCQARMMASNGRCKTFDASADGYVRGEGCGVVVLKRLSDALADSDRVLAVISGSAVNQDGLTNGLTAPNGPSQQAVLRAALAAAGRRPHEVSFVETHGTGTSLGDPIEVRSLRNVLMENRPADCPCWLGAVKTNIGHLESAAGIAGLQKLVLAMQHQQIPPNLHFQKLNPLIALDGTALRLPVEVTNWHSDAVPRVAGVSSFGFGGTNCHVIVEQPPALASPAASQSRPVHVLALSAKSDRALLDTATRFAACAANLSADDPANLCGTANVGRSKFRWRKAIVAADMAALRRELDQLAATTVDQLVTPPRVGKKAPKVAFLFTGQGSQYVNMGRQLYEYHRVFREQLDRCDALLRPLLPQPLLSVLFPQDNDSTLLNETLYTQPALFALEYALAQLWMSWGIHPQAAMGHSVGQYVACCLADVFSLEDGIRLVAQRGRLMQQLPPDGRMVVVSAAEETVAAALVGRDRDVAIAAVNAPNQTVISGRAAVVDSVVRELQQQGVRCSGLTVSHAFHSPLMDPVLAEFRKFAEGVQFSAPTFEIISNVTGESAGAELQTPEYWCQHIRQTVRFADSIQCLAKKKPAVFLEIGPKPILTALGQACVADKSCCWLSSLRGRDDDCRNMFTSLGRLFESGANVDWRAFSADCQFTKITLPTYPFQHQRCWMEFDTPHFGRPASAKANNGHPAHPLFDLRMEVAGKDTVYQTTLSTDRFGYLREHQVLDAVVVPAALFAELALAAGQDKFGTAVATLADLAIRQALKLDPDHPRIVQVVIGQKDSAPEFRIYSQSRPRAQSGELWSLHASGSYVSGAVADEPAPGIRESLSKAMTTDFDIDQFYACHRATGLTYGPAFRCLQQLKCGAGEAIGEVRLPEPLQEQAGAHQLHPALLDGCLQVMLAALPESQLRWAYLPVGLKSLQIHRPGVTSVWSHVRIRPESGPGGIGVIGDIRLLDAEDQVVASIQGLELRRMHSRMLAQQLQPPHPDWLYRVDWQVKPPNDKPTPVPCQAGSCLILADDQGVGVELAEHMRSCGQRCVVVQAAGRFARLSRDEFQVRPGAVGDLQQLLNEAFGDDCEAPQRVVHLWSLNAVPFADLACGTLDQSLRCCCETTLNLLHALVKSREKHPPGLWLVTRGSQAIDGSQSVVEPLPACLWGMARVIGWEHPSLRPVCIDLDPERPGEDVAQLIGEILDGDADDEVAFRRSERFVPRIVSCGERIPDTPELNPCPIRDDRTYLVTGGLGGLGSKVAEWLVECGARSLVLIGRRQPSAESRKTIARLEHAGAEVTVINVDVSARADVDTLLDHISKHLPPLAGVFHAAGVLDDGVLMQLDWSKFQRVLAAKVAGALHLHQATAEMPLDLFVSFSSVTSMLGAPGQANYAAANAFLDALAHRRAALGQPALSVNWGPWDSIGMTADFGPRDRARWEVGGVSTIPVDQGLDILEQLLGQTRPQVGVLPISWSKFLTQLPRGQNWSLLAEVAKQAGQEEAGTSAPPSRSAILGKLRVAPGQRQIALVRDYVLERIAATLGVTVGQLDASQPLMAAGFDSIMVLELKGTIESDLEITLALGSLVADVTAEDLANEVTRAALANLRTGTAATDKEQPGGHA